MTDLISLAVAERIATVTLGRPPVNAFNAEMFEAFHGILDGLSKRSDWSVLHIRSALKVFSGGADLAEISTHFAAPDKMDAAAKVTRPFQELFQRISRPAAGEPGRDRRRGHGRRLRAGAWLRPEDRRQRGQARPAGAGPRPAAGRRRARSG